MWSSHVAVTSHVVSYMNLSHNSREKIQGLHRFPTMYILKTVKIELASNAKKIIKAESNIQDSMNRSVNTVD